MHRSLLRGATLQDRIHGLSPTKPSVNCAEYGAVAFPFLIKHLNDRRQSVAMRRVMPANVGDACYCIITQQLYALPDGYRGSFYRKGSDGELHERPVSMVDLFSHQSLTAWLEKRKGKSLTEMQIEALSWVIEKERAIGARTKDDENEFLAPLETRLKSLKASLSKSTERNAPPIGAG
jgi:hypothetical protein